MGAERRNCGSWLSRKTKDGRRLPVLGADHYRGGRCGNEEVGTRPFVRPGPFLLISVRSRRQRHHLRRQSHHHLLRQRGHHYQSRLRRLYRRHHRSCCRSYHSSRQSLGNCWNPKWKSPSCSVSSYSQSYSWCRPSCLKTRTCCPPAGPRPGCSLLSPWSSRCWYRQRRTALARRRHRLGFPRRLTVRRRPRQTGVRPSRSPEASSSYLPPFLVHNFLVHKKKHAQRQFPWRQHARLILFLWTKGWTPDPSPLVFPSRSSAHFFRSHAWRVRQPSHPQLRAGIQQRQRTFANPVTRAEVAWS